MGVGMLSSQVLPVWQEKKWEPASHNVRPTDGRFVHELAPSGKVIFEGRLVEVKA